MKKFLEQTGEKGYFDIRLTTGEAIALLDSLSQGEYFRSENGDKPHPELQSASEKISRGWMIMTRDGNNKLV